MEGLKIIFDYDGEEYLADFRDYHMLYDSFVYVITAIIDVKPIGGLNEGYEIVKAWETDGRETYMGYTYFSLGEWDDIDFIFKAKILYD